MRLPAAPRLPHGPQEEEAQPQVQGRDQQQGQEVSHRRVPGTGTEAEDVGLGRLGTGPATSTNPEVVNWTNS